MEPCPPSTSGPDRPTARTRAPKTVRDEGTISLRWTTGRGTLCPICRMRSVVVRAHTDEPYLCARCFVSKQG